jgi:cyclopropane-fatty-acyl-phospholipid synthase
MAERYPASRIVAVSNSASQRTHIMAEAAARGFGNVDVRTADMNLFATTDTFDRVVSVEMFEHMSNWRALLKRARGWLRADGLLFMHVFSHRAQPYRFDLNDEADWIAQYFFTGGVMPSHGLIKQFDDLFDVQQEWRWSGEHYRRTAMDWLAEFDARPDEVARLMSATYGTDAALWTRRWRLFFLATAGLFGHRGGEEWGVSHYLLRPASAA